MGKVAGMLYGSGYQKLGDIVKRAGQIATDPFAVNKKGKTVVDAGGNMSVVYGGKGNQTSGLGTITKKPNESASTITSPKMQGPPKELAPSITDVYGESGSGSGDKGTRKILEQIGLGWGDSGDMAGDTSKALSRMKGDAGKIGKLSDRYKEASRNYYDRTEKAVAGNKKLIEQEQRNKLDDIAEDVRKNIFNTNLNLGTLNASNSSAAGRFAKVLGNNAGKSRAQALRGYGEQTIEQDQSLDNAKEQLSLRIKQSDDWRKTQEAAAKEAYQSFKKTLDRMKSKAPSWKREDLDAESDRNLQNYKNTLATIQGKVAEYRGNLSNIADQFGLNIDEIESSALELDTPAALEVPDYTEDWNFTGTDSGAEDWYDDASSAEQKAKNRKQIGTDVFGNPIYEDELAATPA